MGLRVRSIVSSAGKRPYYYKLILVTLLISLIPSTIISIIYFRTAVDDERIRIEESNTLYLKLIGNSLDIVLDNILDFANLLAIDPQFSEYSGIADKNFFENFPEISSVYSQEDYKRLYDYYDARSNIYRTLDTMTLSNEFIDSIYYLDTSRNMVFSNGKLPSALKYFPDSDWYRYISSNALLPQIMPLRQIRSHLDSSPPRSVISLVTENAEEKTPFILNISSDVLYKRIIDHMDWNPADFFFVMSSDSEPLLYATADREVIGSLSILLNGVEKGTLSEVSLDHKQYMVCSLYLDSTGWTIYSITDSHNYYNSIHKLRINLFMISMLVFFISILLVFILGQILYSPIQRLSGYARSLQHGPEQIQLGDLGFIRQTLSRSEQREKEHELLLSESLPLYRKSFYHGLLEGRIHDEQELEERLEQLQSALSNDESVVLLIQLDDLSRFSDQEDVIQDRVLKQVFQASWNPEIPSEFFSCAPRLYSLIVNSGQLSRETLLQSSTDLSESLRNSLCLEATIGIGTAVMDLLSLERSFNEAREILRLRAISDKGSILFYEDLNSDDQNLLSYDPGFKVQVLLDSIRTANTRECLMTLEQIHGELLSRGSSISLSRTRRFYYTLLSDILRTIESLGIDYEEIPGNEDPFDRLHSLQTLKDIHGWLIHFVMDLTDALQSRCREQQNSSVKKILEAVKRDCGQDINLNTIADSLSLNPSYVSRLFKESMNTSFIDYLTEIRMNKAMALLKDSELKISEVAVEVGYFNSNYFIRLFKKKTGHTPGEYRRIFR